MSIFNLNLNNDLESIFKQYFIDLESLIPDLRFYNQIKDEFLKEIEQRYREHKIIKKKENFFS